MGQCRKGKDEAKAKAGNFKCEKCGAASEKKGHLCKPEKIKKKDGKKRNNPARVRFAVGAVPGAAYFRQNSRFCRSKVSGRLARSRRARNRAQSSWSSLVQ